MYTFSLCLRISVFKEETSYKKILINMYVSKLICTIQFYYSILFHIYVITDNVLSFESAYSTYCMNVTNLLRRLSGERQSRLISHSRAAFLQLRPGSATTSSYKPVHLVKIKLPPILLETLIDRFCSKHQEYILRRHITLLYCF